LSSSCDIVALPGLLVYTTLMCVELHCGSSLYYNNADATSACNIFWTVRRRLIIS